MKRLSIAIAAMAVAAALGAGTASAAAPRIIIVSGKPLAQQVVIANWQSIFAVVDEVANARVVQRRQLAGRPSLKVSMFWGPRWNDYLSKGNRASALRPKQADQFGSFYPAWRGRPARDRPTVGRSLAACRPGEGAGDPQALRRAGQRSLAGLKYRTSREGSRRFDSTVACASVLSLEEPRTQRHSGTGSPSAAEPKFKGVKS